MKMHYSKMQNVTRVLLRFASFLFERNRCEMKIRVRTGGFLLVFSPSLEIRAKGISLHFCDSLSAVLDGEVKIKKIKKTRTTRCDDDDAETTTTTTAKYCASLFV